MRPFGTCHGRDCTYRGPLIKTHLFGDGDGDHYYCRKCVDDFNEWWYCKRCERNVLSCECASGPE